MTLPDDWIGELEAVLNQGARKRADKKNPFGWFMPCLTGLEKNRKQMTDIRTSSMENKTNPQNMSGSIVFFNRVSYAIFMMQWASMHNRPHTAQWIHWGFTRHGWVLRTAIGVAVFVFVVPLLLLTLAAILAGVVVFIALALVVWVISLPLRLLGAITRGMSDDGRRNVRVVVRDT